jgi:hypothetical protein
MTTRYSQDALDLYRHTLRQGWLRRGAALGGRAPRLFSLAEAISGRAVSARHAGGTHAVPIAQIGGSEGRAGDFDQAFRPLGQHGKGRWLRVADAYLLGVGLPPVELIRVGEVYFVRDGHHRISVARAIGQQHIDAVVTVWEMAGEA